MKITLLLFIISFTLLSCSYDTNYNCPSFSIFIRLPKTELKLGNKYLKWDTDETDFWGGISTNPFLADTVIITGIATTTEDTYIRYVTSERIKVSYIFDTCSEKEFIATTKEIK